MSRHAQPSPGSLHLSCWCKALQLYLAEQWCTRMWALSLFITGKENERKSKGTSLQRQNPRGTQGTHWTQKTLPVHHHSAGCRLLWARHERQPRDPLMPSSCSDLTLVHQELNKEAPAKNSQNPGPLPCTANIKQKGHGHFP